MITLGSFPFGAPVKRLVQTDRRPKRVFVLGVYASAVHARWSSPEGKVLVRALAVASEPEIFWNGAGAAQIVAGIEVPADAGRLLPAAPTLNGPSGRSLDDDFLAPLAIERDQAWLCDLVPHACLNPNQRAAIDREYTWRAGELGLPAVSLPAVPRVFADESRRAEILSEIDEAKPEVIVLLGDQPIRHWLRFYDRRWVRLSDFGSDERTYGRVHEATIAGRPYRVLPLAHPRQVSGLGTHSGKWRSLHSAWKRSTRQIFD